MMMTKNCNLIAFAGRMRSGKTELANYLVEKYGFVKLSAATALKLLCVELLDIHNVNELNYLKDNNIILNIKPNDKWFEIISEKTGIIKDVIKHEIEEITFQNVRQMLQIIGTDLIRKYKIQWHVEQLENEINNLLEQGKRVTVDDIRFMNEYKLIKKLNGEVFYVNRDSSIKSVHESENSIKLGIFDKHHIINNDGTIQDLQQKIMELYK